MAGDWRVGLAKAIEVLKSDANPAKRPEVREKISEASKRMWNDPEFREQTGKKISEAKGRMFTKEELEELYLNQKKSMADIAKEKGCSQGGVEYLLEKYKIPRRNYKEAYKIVYRKKPELSQPKLKIDLKPSNNLAYILGVLLGDGWVIRQDYSMGLGVTKKEFAESFANALRAIGLNPNVYKQDKKLFQKVSPNANDIWMVRGRSKQFYEWYKGLNLEKIKEVIKGYEVDFIRGFYESEGSCRLSGKRSEVAVHNTDRDLIIFISGLLTGLGFHYSITKTDRRNSNWKDLYHLNILGQKEEKFKFLKTINPVIKGGN
uniref:DOD-type homing endonuclease domain-containing protein n=1 Tax=Caldisericum exile TaxID=693075 RepID=A0A7C4XTN8_9BACT